MSTTLDEIIARAKREQPELKLAVSENRTAIGAWSEAQGRFVMVAGLLLTGQWASMPVEVWIDGKPPVSNWTPV